MGVVNFASKQWKYHFRVFVLKNSNSCSNLLRRCIAHSIGLVVKVERIRDVFGNTRMRERPTGQDNTETRSSPPLRHNSTDNSFFGDAKGRIRAQAHGRRRNLNQRDWAYRLVRTNRNSIQEKWRCTLVRGPEETHKLSNGNIICFLT